MKILGINALNHDAAITLIDSDNGKILFAAHAERYSGCLLYTSPSPRDNRVSRMPSSA